MGGRIQSEQVDGFDRNGWTEWAGIRTGKAFLTYRKRGGSRTAPLPDFLIGAHAAVSGMRLLTRDPARYRGYYPNVEIVGPAKS
jgi:hypothetical protein